MSGTAHLQLLAMYTLLSGLYKHITAGGLVWYSGIVIYLLSCPAFCPIVCVSSVLVSGCESLAYSALCSLADAVAPA